MGDSSCFSPYMSMGLVCDGAAGGCSPTVHRQGLTSFLTTPVDSGQALHLYDTNLHLKGVSQRLPSSWTKETGSTVISHVAACHRLTFAAVGTSIIVFRRLVPFGIWKKHTNRITVLTIVGDILVSISEDGQLLAWSLPSTDREIPSENGQITCELFLPPNFKPSTIAHPQTYINKVLLGGHDGQCLLVNLRSKRIVHTFSGFSSRITVLQPSPVIDVIGVGLEDGRILLHNFRIDETIIQFQHGEANITGNTDEALEETKSAAVVKTLSFRSDGTEVLMSGDGAGNMYTWDLNEKTLVSETRKIHPGGIIFAEFLPGEPLLITTGMTDNAVKIHIFDNPLGQPRILRKRVGHSLPPTIVRFCGYDGFMMVSAGLDRELRLVSTVHEARNRKFGQGLATRKGSKARKRRRTEEKTEIGEQMVEMWRKLPQVTDIASGNLRQRDEDFANIVTIHAGRKEAFTWRVQSGALHQHILSAPDHPQRYRLAFRRNAVETQTKKQLRQYVKKPSEVFATCVTVTPCGNYAIVGQNDGLVHSYNLQSGIHQGAYDGSSTDKSQQDTNRWPAAHDCSVVTIAMGSCGDLLASAGAADKKIKFWNTHGRLPNGQEILSPSNISIMRWCTTSDLLAVSCEDFSVRVYDASTRKLARLFSAHVAPIVDISFDTEGRRIFSASIDNTIKTWYLPTGQNTDTMICDQAPTSIAVAPGGGFLATTHVNDRSIKLWVDESKYGPLPIRKDGIEEDISTDNGSEDEDGSSSISNQEKKSTAPNTNEEAPGAETFPESLSTGLRTLSNKPSSQWTVLSNLREIKERNKPIEPPKKPENAPFFLPTLKGLGMQFDTSKAIDNLDEPGTRVNTSNTTGDDEEWSGNSEFGKLIRSGENEKAHALLQSLDPSGVDLQIRTLEGEKTRLMTARFFGKMLRNPEDFELTQAYLTVFLSSQGMELSAQEQGAEALEELVEYQKSAWEDLRRMFDSVLALSGHFSGQV